MPTIITTKITTTPTATSLRPTPTPAAAAATTAEAAAAAVSSSEMVGESTIVAKVEISLAAAAEGIGGFFEASSSTKRPACRTQS